jgi:hypothetical protein
MVDLSHFSHRFLGLFTRPGIDHLCASPLVLHLSANVNKPQLQEVPTNPQWAGCGRLMAQKKPLKVESPIDKPRKKRQFQP